ncbi:hypothetical protein BOTBODRAFT_62314 [Botryobasidium botryosum FD-172 SS1]|uniref:Uncharacterized protein n=1 Tax=Botryobasidium botryosum (strain FD-172 SS1) TaxID=930990 RepID=A0A067N739_BOTB1|nr:hypothetical protein BOTBODRAFT_62314 [Botryobasidium botryosum FD-172 SS1]
MAKTQKKTGKGRIDKYYKLAKEQGYRARSAFKLIQLNKKYAFLESARCCIDLCAAPGGWLQVASKYMPTGSLIIGVDLVPIKPIPRVISFPADITTSQCRTGLRSHMKDWQADVVLHDGAPNVGTAWVQDAYQQSELVLHSLKLATEFLAKGGTFVTKVFRSQDYNSLLWVFSQLFSKVEATKPPSSRNVSAEIFVVCTNFLAPLHIDPKFLDPKHVFKDVNALPPAPTDGSNTVLTPANVNVFQPGKKRRHRDGYADGDYTLYKAASAEEFVNTNDPITFLGSVNKVEFKSEEEKAWLSLDITTHHIKANFEDLKVLGKGEFKALIKWRLAIREEIGLDVKKMAAAEHTETAEVTEPVDEEQMIEDELERLNTEAASRARRDRRRKNEKKQKTVQRMQLRMVAPMDIGMEFDDAQLRGGMGADDVFDLGQAEKGGVEGDVTDRGSDGDGSDSDDDTKGQAGDQSKEFLDSDEEREARIKGLEGDMDEMYDAYRERMAARDAKWKVRESRLKDEKRQAWGGIEKKEGSDSEEEGDEEDSEEGGWDRVQEAKARADEGSDSEWGSEAGSDDEEVPSPKRRKVAANSKSKSLVTKLVDPKAKVQASKAARIWFGQDVFAGVADIDDIEDDGDEDEESADEDGGSEEDSTADDDEAAAPSEEEDDFEIVPQEPDDTTMWDVDGENEDEEKQRYIQKSGLVTAEAVSLAQQLVNRQTTRTHLINDGFNRHSFNHKDGLPTWFLDDEQKHYKANIPVTKEAMQLLRARQRALDARPIKKVAEAKARKKARTAMRLEKAVKKAEGIAEGGDMTEREKAKAVDKLLRKGLSSKDKKKNQIQLVVAKGASKGVKGRPKGVKGRYQMVDSRGKKELRAKKRKEKASKKRKRA